MASEADVSIVFVMLSGILILVAIVFLFLFYRFVKLKNQIFKEKKEEKNLVNGAELLALSAQMKPHFIFNALNTILYFIQQNDMEKSEEFVSKMSFLMRNFFEYSRQKDLTVAEELEFIHQYLEIEKLRFEEKLNFVINVAETIDVEIVRIPSMILQPILENAINHGIFHKSGKGKIDVFFYAIKENSYQIMILDNGIGINKSKEFHQKTNKVLGTRSGNVLEEKLKLLKASQHWNIDYKIEDLSDIGHQHSGTKVTLIVEAL